MAKTYIKPEILLITMENGTSLLSGSGGESPTGIANYYFGGGNDAQTNHRNGVITSDDSDDFIQGGKRGGYLWDD